MKDETIYFEPGAAARLGGYAWEETAGTLRAGQDSGDCMPTIAVPFRKMAHPQTAEKAQNWETAEVSDTLNIFDNSDMRTPNVVLNAISVESNQSDARMKIREDGTVQTLLGRMGTGGNNIPLVGESWDGSQTAPTLTVNNANGAQRMPDKDNFNAVLAVDGYNQSAGDVTKSLSSAATDSDHVPFIAKRGDNDATTRNEVLCLLWQTYGEEEVSKWGTDVLAALQQADVLRQGVHEKGIQGETEDGDKLDDSSLPCPSTVAGWLLRDVREHEECGCPSQGWESSEQRTEQSPEALQELSQQGASSCKDLFHLWSQGKGIRLLQQALHQIQEIRRSPLHQSRYIVRRLTPLETERLQGFPDRWTDIGEWIDSKGKRRQTTDSARYKAIGNSIAVGFANEQRGFWMWLMKRISAQYERKATLGSLFDGISGFPLAWATYNGPDSCLWSSEIEEFCIAVAKKHFGDGETEGDVNEYLRGAK